MDLGLTEEQEMLRKMARDFLTNECPKSLVRAMEEDERGYSPELWRKTAELGWPGLAFPEAYGGMGGSFLDLCVLLEEMGRALLPGPFFSTVVLGGLPLLAAGTEAQKKEFLPRLSRGELVMTMALTEPSGTWDASGVKARAARSDGGFTITGAKLFVPNAHVADVLLVVARTEPRSRGENGLTLFLVDGKSPGIRCTQLKTIASDKQSEVVFNKVAVPDARVLGPVSGGWPIVAQALEKAAAAQCALMVGGAQQVLEMTVDYAKTRVQFGRPIGTFQAIQHKCANMVTDVDGARFVAYQAAWRLSEGLPATTEVSIAKAWVSDAYRRACAEGHQIHGGIGFTKDHDMQLFFRRAKAGELAFGDGDFHREVVARQLAI